MSPAVVIPTQIREEAGELLSSVPSDIISHDRIIETIATNSRIMQFVNHYPKIRNGVLTTLIKKTEVFQPYSITRQGRVSTWRRA